MKSAKTDDQQAKEGLLQRSTILIGDIEPNETLTQLFAEEQAQSQEQETPSSSSSAMMTEDEDGDAIMSEIQAAKKKTGCLARSKVTIRWLALDDDDDDNNGEEERNVYKRKNGSYYCNTKEDGCGNKNPLKFNNNVLGGDTTCNECGIVVDTNTDRREPAVLWTDLSAMLRRVPLLSHFSGLTSAQGVCSKTHFWNELSSYFYRIDVRRGHTITMHKKGTGVCDRGLIILAKGKMLEQIQGSPSYGAITRKLVAPATMGEYNMFGANSSTYFTDYNGWNSDKIGTQTCIAKTDCVLFCLAQSSMDTFLLSQFSGLPNTTSYTSCLRNMEYHALLRCDPSGLQQDQQNNYLMLSSSSNVAAGSTNWNTVGMSVLGLKSSMISSVLSMIYEKEQNAVDDVAYVENFKN